MFKSLITIFLVFGFALQHANGTIIIKGPFSQKVCCTDYVCFNDMEVISDDPQDSVWVWLVNTDGIPVNYSSTWQGRFEQWNLCWQTKDSDGKLESYMFDICATNKKDTVCKTFKIYVDPLPKSCRTYTYLGNDSFLFQLSDTSRFARGDSTIRFCEWTVPYPAGNKHYDCSIKFKNLGLSYILVESRLNATYFGCDIVDLDTVDLQRLSLGSMPENTAYQTYFSSNKLYIKSTYSFSDIMHLYQLDGKLLINIAIGAFSENYISTDLLTPGIYLLASTQTSFMRKVVIVK